MISKSSIEFQTVTRYWPNLVLASLIMGISIVMPMRLMAQVDSAHVELIAVSARPAKDSILLRWAPLTYHAWRTGNREGYRIERYTIIRDGKLLSRPEKILIEGGVRPLPESAWEKLVTADRYAAIAAQALFGDRFELDLTQSDIFTIVNKIKENEQRFAFALFSADMSPQVAKASGLWFTDKSVKAGEKYLYRVIINNGDDLLQGSTFVAPDDDHRLPTPQNLQAEFNDKTVSLRWNRLPPSVYTAFALERSTDGTNFRKISDTPVVTLATENQPDLRYEYATDSLPESSVTYYYRVRGITPFGEESLPSGVVKGQSIAEVENVPYITSAVSNNNTSILLEWEFPETSNPAILGFRVERSFGPDEKYHHVNDQLVSPAKRTYEDLTPGQVNYYRIQALSKTGELYPSHVYFAQLVDSIPPAVPSGLEATVSDSGEIFLSWKPNSDLDIYGYRLYRSWLLSEEPSQVTSAPIRSHHFRDSVRLNTLNENIYYQLMAIDVNQNHSGLSQSLKVSLPDKVKPQPPVMLPTMADSTGVALSWSAGASEDIVEYRLYRKTTMDPAWRLIFSVNAMPADSIYRYVDYTCAPGKPVYYTVTSVDDSALESEPAAPTVNICNPSATSHAVLWRKPQVTRDENLLTLSWDYEEQNLHSFRLFRSVNKTATVLLKTVDAAVRKYADTIVPGNQYAYRIIACFDNGKKSAMSEELNFEY